MEERPRCVFMAFGTKGDVNPIAGVAAAFATDQSQYMVYLITHSAHENLSEDLRAKGVFFVPVSTPPVLSSQHHHQQPPGDRNAEASDFALQKKAITREHRLECLKAVEMIFGDGPSLQDDFIVINFFALEGWSLAELFRVRCVVAAPYVVPYSAPASFERHFRKEFPLLYKCLQEAPEDKASLSLEQAFRILILICCIGNRYLVLNMFYALCWKDDPVTSLPILSDWLKAPLLLYGFSEKVVECPGYWPSNAQVCGFWFLPMEWQFSCSGCRTNLVTDYPGHLHAKFELCAVHMDLQLFLTTSTSDLPIFIGLSSVGRQVHMGFLKNPQAFLRLLGVVVEITNRRFILFSAGYEPLDRAINVLAGGLTCSNQKRSCEGFLLFDNRVFCFSGTVPYSWLFPKCAVAVHHGGSGSTAAALLAGVPQVICPFLLDQFYWAERMFWLGVSPEPLHKDHLLPDEDDEISIRRAATSLSNAIRLALSPDTKALAADLARRISSEDGVGEAAKILKEEIVRC
ncbi:hypothetical protein Sjap_018615 [Stephania japonica]|uniref:Erythromycin biosynthesis protein CIII-like C-terminal domain-containing protein n=1 Tax=Stephania japonica TaxID=461633 RepID=A0AAP0I8E8_9MAGN